MGIISSRHSCRSCSYGHLILIELGFDFIWIWYRFNLNEILETRNRLLRLGKNQHRFNQHLYIQRYVDSSKMTRKKWELCVQIKLPYSCHYQPLSIKEQFFINNGASTKDLIWIKWPLRQGHKNNLLFFILCFLIVTILNLFHLIF